MLVAIASAQWSVFGHPPKFLINRLSVSGQQILQISYYSMCQHSHQDCIRLKLARPAKPMTQTMIVMKFLMILVIRPSARKLVRNAPLLLNNISRTT